MSMTAHPVWFKDIEGKWSQINGVIDIVIATPLVGRGTYRDKPPVTPASAAQVVGDLGSTPGSNQVQGGVTPVAASTVVTGSVYQNTLISPSSIVEDDDYTHEPLRYVFGPEPMIFFKTSVAGSPALPDDTTYSTDRPDVPALGSLTSGGTFTVITGDCFFGWDYKRCGVSNAPPQGWVVFTGA